MGDFRLPPLCTWDLRKDMFCGRKEFSPLAYSISELTTNLLIICIYGKPASWRGSIHRKALTHAEKYTDVSLQTPRRFRARYRIVSHEKEQRRAAMATSPTIMLSGSTYKKPSGVAELGRKISCKRTSLVNVCHISLAVSWIRRAVAIITTRNFDFHLTSALVGIALDKVGPETVLPLEGWWKFSFHSNM